VAVTRKVANVRSVESRKREQESARWRVQRILLFLFKENVK